MTAEQDFFAKMLPYAQEASGKTGLFVSVILAQWANESNYGTSRLALEDNNYGGINFVQGASIAAGADGGFAKYESIDQFVQDYARVMNLSFYSKVRADKTEETEVQDLGASPYAESHYGGHGEWLQNIVNQFSLKSYDNQGSGAAAITAKNAAIGAAFLAFLALAGVSRG